MGFLGGGNRIFAFAHSQGDHFVGDPADFLGLGFGSRDPAVPDQVGHLVTKQRLALIRGATQLALVSHGNSLLN